MKSRKHLQKIVLKFTLQSENKNTFLSQKLKTNKIRKMSCQKLDSTKVAEKVNTRVSQLLKRNFLTREKNKETKKNLEMWTRLSQSQTRTYI